MEVEHGVDHGAKEVMPFLVQTGRCILTVCPEPLRELLSELGLATPDGVRQVNHWCREAPLPMHLPGPCELAAIFPEAHDEGDGLGDDLCMHKVRDNMPAWKLTRAGWEEGQVVNVPEQGQGVAGRVQVQLLAVRQVPQDCGNMAAGVDGAVEVQFDDIELGRRLCGRQTRVHSW